MLSRRNFLKGSLVTAAASVVGITAPALAQTVSQTQVGLAMDIMRDQGQSQYLLVDKRNAQIHIIRDGQILATSNVVLGENRSDIFLRNTGSTGAGIFRMVPMAARNRPDSTIAFRADDRLPYGQYTIHRVIPSGVRLNALQTTSPADNFLSNGCVNVPNDFYNLIWSSFADTQGRFRSGFDIVILPEDVSRTAEFLSRRGGLSETIPTRRRTINSDLLTVSAP